jgi:hypothetical protein
VASEAPRRLLTSAAQVFSPSRLRIAGYLVRGCRHVGASRLCARRCTRH